MSRAGDQDASTEARLAKLEAILRTAVNAIVTIDCVGTIESVNPATSLLFGYPAEELIGVNVKLLMPEPYAYEHDGYLANYLKTGVKKIIGTGRQLTGRRKDGTTFPIDIAVSEFEADGQRRFTGVITDLTDRYATQQALKESERRLVQAQKMEAVGQLAGGIAHDFNNLLTIIIGNLELIEPQLSDEPQRQLLNRIQEAAVSGSNLTHRLLAFSRLQPLAPQVVKLNSLVVRTSELLRRSIGDHITLTTGLASGLWDVRADPNQVENALMNLAINARDAMPQGGRLMIETRNVVVDAEQVGAGLDLTPGDYVAMSVSDTGAGIPPEIRNRVFEPFFTTKPIGRGSGLGLAMIYGFAKQSSGDVTLYSEVDHGTIVTMYLPRAGTRAVSRLTVDPATQQSAATGGLVLLVEDDPGVRQLNLTRLKQLGYEVVEAINGAKALELVKGGLRPDLVFSDVIMPGGLSGRDLYEQTIAIVPAMKFLLTTGYSEEMVNPEGAAAMTVRVLRKPYRTAELADAVREALRSGC